MPSYTQSACDCYCRTRVPIARRREEIQSERSRVRGSRSSVLKMATARSAAKRVPLIAAKVVSDEQLDSKRSTVTLPVSPVLSPGTTATLENVEKLIKDAEIQMKEISMTASCSRFQNSINVRPDEATFDDENDQLLYVRECVAYKFQEANGLIDTACGNNRRRFSNEERHAIEPTSKRLVDLSAPKFQTSEDRYEKFSRQRRLDIQKLGLALSYSIDDPPGNDETAKKMDDRASSPGKETGRDARMDVFSVRTGPSVNIKGDLVAQNLGNIHIPPDPSFTRENQNVGTYVVRHEFHRTKNECSGRREKIARITEDAEKSKKRNTESNDVSDSARVPEKSERSESAVLTNIEKLDKSVENVRETESSSMKDSENGKNFESANFCRDGSVPRENLEVSTRGISNDSVASGTFEQQETVKITFKSEQKQVRFEESNELLRKKKTVNPLGTECRKNRLETEEATRILEAKNLRTPSMSIELEARRIASDKTEQYEYSSKQFKANDEHTPLSSREIAEKHKANTEKHKEIREDRYREINERFANIVRTHCDRDEERSNSCEEFSNVLSSSVLSTEASEESDNLNLYEPCINDLDDVLISYDKIIGNVVQSTRTIDRFLSRPELQEYCVENSGGGEIARKSNNPVSSNREKIAETETDNSFVSQRKQSAMDLLRSRDERIEMRNSRIKSDGARERSSPQTELRKCRSRSSKEKLKKIEVARSRGPAIESKESPIFDRNSLVANGSLNEKRNPNEMERVEAATLLSLKTFSLANFDGDTSKRISDESATKTKNLKTKDRPDRSAWERRASSEGTTAETSEDNNRNSETKQTFPRKARLFRIVNDSSSLTASSICPLTSSTATKSANDTKLSEEFLEEGAILKINPSETNKEEAERDDRLQNVVSSDVLKRIILEKGKLETLVTRLVTREDTRFAEDMASNFERDSENSVDSRTKSDDENLISARTDPNVADESTASERCRITETLKDSLPHDVSKEEINLIENAGKSEENLLKPGDSEDSNENLVVSGGRIESFVEPHSIENTGDDDGFVKKISQDSSDSLRDCASLRSSLKSLSNNTKPSQQASELKRTETCNANDDKIEKRNSPHFDGMFEKEKILSDVYDEMNKKLFSSTCLDANTNHSSFLNRQRFSNGISTISTIRSNKVEISSDTSHSEGELYMPSSGSYSLGEIRVLTKNRSDSENIDNFDSNVAIFVTKEMLTSWSESSKSLVQSMGEI